jgi:hypothetical protein
MRQYALINTESGAVLAAGPVKFLRKIADAHPQDETEIILLPKPNNMKTQMAQAHHALNMVPNTRFIGLTGEKTNSYAAALAIGEAINQIEDYHEVFAYAGMMCVPEFWSGETRDQLEDMIGARGTASMLLLACEIAKDFLARYPIGTDFDALATDWWDAMETVAQEVVNIKYLNA